MIINNSGTLLLLVVMLFIIAVPIAAIVLAVVLGHQSRPSRRRRTMLMSGLAGIVVSGALLGYAVCLDSSRALAEWPLVFPFYAGSGFLVGAAVGRLLVGAHALFWPNRGGVSRFD